MESSYYYLLAKMVALLRFISALKFRQLPKTRRFIRKLNLKRAKKLNFFALFPLRATRVWVKTRNKILMGC